MGRPARPGAIEDGRSYPTAPSDDCALVCALVGLDMQAVTARVKHQIAAAPMPAELGRAGHHRLVPGHAQARLTRKPFKHETIIWHGMTLTDAGWAARLGIATNTLQGRILRGGLPLLLALTLSSDHARLSGLGGRTSSGSRNMCDLAKEDC